MVALKVVQIVLNVIGVAFALFALYRSHRLHRTYESQEKELKARIEELQKELRLIPFRAYCAVCGDRLNEGQAACSHCGTPYKPHNI